MELPIFETLSARDDKAIPFKLNEKGLAEWMGRFEHSNDHYLSCRQMLAALQALNSRDVEPKLRFTLLDNVGLALNPHIKRLEQPFMAGSVPLSPPEQANYELITSSYASLAQGYWRIACDIAALQQPAAFATLMAKALYAGLDALKRVLLYTAEVYERPYAGFWKACYQFYRLAENHKLLEVKVEDSKCPTTVAGNFKSLLAFYLSGSSQFNPRDMRELLKFLEHNVDSIIIRRQVDEKERQFFFRFSFDNDAPPANARHQSEELPGMCYLSAIKIAKTAYDMLKQEASAWSEACALKQPQLAIVVKNLGMGSHRKFIRVSVKKNYFGIVGYENILNFLRKSAVNGFNAGVEPFDPRIAGTWKLPDLELMPLSTDEENSGWKKLVDPNADDRHIDVQLAWNEQPHQSDIPSVQHAAERFGEFNIVNSNVKGYGILTKEKNLKAGLGDFVGIINSDGGNKNRLEVGIIRRIGRPEPAVISFGVELIAYEAEATCIYRPGNLLTKSWAVILRGIEAIKQPDSMIFSSHTFSVGEEICLERGNKVVRCVIKKIMYATPSVVHAEVEVVKQS